MRKFPLKFGSPSIRIYRDSGFGQIRLDGDLHFLSVLMIYFIHQHQW